MHPSVAVLESALRARKLDRTLTTALPPLERVDPSSLSPLDIPVVDACLHGGVPRGQQSELTGACSSGRMTLLVKLMSAATRRGELAAFIDTCDRLDVASVAAAGVDLDRLLWVRGPAHCLLPAVDIVDRALKALDLVLQAGGFGLVAIDLAEAPPAALRQIPVTSWRRVQRAIEGSDTACVLVTGKPLARSAGGLTLLLAGRARWAGASPVSRRLQGVDVHVRVVSPRKRIDGDLTIGAAARDGL